MKNKNINEEVRYCITDEENCRVIEVACYNQKHECGGPIIEISDNKTSFELNANNLDCVIEALLKISRRLTPFMDAENFEKNKASLRDKGLGAWCDLFEEYHSKKAEKTEVCGHDFSLDAVDVKSLPYSSDKESLEENEYSGSECMTNEHEDLNESKME